MGRTRREFIQGCAAALSAPALAQGGSASRAAGVDGPLTNWAGNLRYSTGRVTRAASVEQVQEFVRKTARFKVLGSRHCFNGIADSAHHLLSLDAMNTVVGLDRDARTVTVESAMKYGELCPYLHEQGFALHNLATLPHISIAGACATATHGSGDSTRQASFETTVFRRICPRRTLRSRTMRSIEAYDGKQFPMGQITTFTLTHFDTRSGSIGE